MRMSYHPRQKSERFGTVQKNERRNSLAPFSYSFSIFYACVSFLDPPERRNHNVLSNPDRH